MLTSTLGALRRLLARQDTGGASSATTLPAPGRRFRSDLIFRLKSWPQLPENGRTAEVYRILSVMSSQPVNRHWLVTRSRMTPRELDELMAKLVAEGAVEVIDPRRFAQSEPCQV